MTIPWQLMSDPHAQVAILYLLVISMLWLGKRSLKHGEAIAKLTVLVTNHYAHRFERIRQRLGVEWEDEDQ